MPVRVWRVSSLAMMATIACALTGCAPPSSPTDEVNASTHHSGTVSPTASADPVSTTGSTPAVKPGAQSSGVTSKNIEGVIYYFGGYPDEWPDHAPVPQGTIEFLLYDPTLDMWSVAVNVEPATADNQMFALHDQYAAEGYYGWDLTYYPLGEFTYRPKNGSFDACGHGRSLNVLKMPSPTGNGTTIGIDLGPPAGVCDGSPS